MNTFFSIKLMCFCRQIRIPVRQYAVKKRFYRHTGVVSNDGKYEVTLDHRKLKTPLGKPFILDNEPLALGVAAEWDAQKEKIQQSSMHLSSLCNTVIDNPNNLNKVDMVHYLVNYITTDTLLFQSSESEALYKLQKEKWDPRIQWFCDRYMVNIKKTTGFDVPTVSEETKATLSKHLLSYNFAALNGITYGVDTLKSMILMLACVDQHLTPQQAVLLSRLEEEHQCEFWGHVEWAHELSQQELQMRLSAAVLFVHLNSYENRTISKVFNK